MTGRSQFISNITVIHVYAPTANDEEAEVDWFHGPTRLSRTNTKKRCPFHHRGLECKSRKSRDNWRDFPAVPVVETALTMKGAEVQSLVRELTSKKDVLFIIWNWNAKVGSQEIPRVTGKFGLEVQNETGQRLTELPREHTGHSKHPLPTT